MPPYKILLSMTTLQRVVLYKEDLQSKKTKPGYYLQQQLNSFAEEGLSFEEITMEQFIQLILSTKKTVCFAESEIKGDGSDWNCTELKILGDVNVAMDVEVYDNGAWSLSEKAFKIHTPPLAAKLLFTPGPLLQGARFQGQTPDFDEIFDRGQIDQDKYTELIKRRLLPIFMYASENAKKENKKALVVLPGIGCGAFAGRFRGKMGEYLNKALQSILEANGEILKNLSCVRYDPFNECVDFEKTIHNINFRLRKNIGRLGKPQLSSVQDFEENENEFENCTLYKIVAWDHASLPGNDYFMGSRNTDDGVSAAATNSMEVITGVKGKYTKGYYLPPEGSLRWESVALKRNTHLVADRNVNIASSDGTCIELSQIETSQIVKTSKPDSSRKTERVRIYKKIKAW